MKYLNVSNAEWMTHYKENGGKIDKGGKKRIQPKEMTNVNKNFSHEILICSRVNCNLSYLKKLTNINNSIGPD